MVGDNIIKYIDDTFIPNNISYNMENFADCYCIVLYSNFNCDKVYSGDKEYIIKLTNFITNEEFFNRITSVFVNKFAKI